MFSRHSHELLRRSKARDYHHCAKNYIKGSSSRFGEYINRGILRSIGVNSPLTSTASREDSQTQIPAVFTARHYATVVPAVTASQNEEVSLLSSSESFARSGNVRDYLRQWSSQQQQVLGEDMPDSTRLHTFQAGLPNSVFGKEDQRPSTDDATEERLAGDDPYNMTDEDAQVGQNLRELHPGDLFLMTLHKIHTQYAIYLGHCDYQAQYLLADGRWFVHTQTQWDGYVFRQFATEGELDTIRSFLPSEPVERASEIADANRMSAHIAGDVPLFASSALLAKMKSLTREVEAYKRQYGQVLANSHDVLAHESLFKLLSLNDILKQCFDVDPELAPEALKLMIIDHFSENFAMLPLVSRETYNISIMPKRFSRAVSNTTEWARQYQDAAARAAMGKDVSQELQKNPLTSFISKARRLITKSRKIRLPSSGTSLGPTLPEAKPSDSAIHRLATGEKFDATDRMIIEFLWLTYVKLPKATASTTAQQMSIGSLILRAVGAYPTLSLEINTGQTFLAELGCLDPWFDRSDHSVLACVSALGLNYDVCTAKARADEALAQLKESWNGTDYPFPDTMAELRKDWGDMEVFAIDKAGTVIIDDGISIEPSDEYADHYWIHVHLAHLSAFLPMDHPFYKLYRIMGAGQYHFLGNEPALPLEIVRSFSIGPNKPVLTCSTLLARNGSVRKVEMSAGIVKNVVFMSPSVIDQKIGAKSIARHHLKVGNITARRKHELSPPPRSDPDDLWQTHGSKLSLLQDLLVARWHSRFKENPNHLKMPRIPKPMKNTQVYVAESIDRSHGRIFRSEHCTGDPEVSIRTTLKSLDCLTEQQPERVNIVTGAMLLAQESAGLWLRQREVPAVYRYSSTRASFDLKKLNTLGKHEGFINLSGGDSTVPSRHLVLGTKQLSVVTNPLRRHTDLINHYNIDAYLKAQAGSSESSMDKIEYPSTSTALTKHIREHDALRYSVQLSGKSHHHWVMQALTRAFTFGEAKLPEVWDFMVDNPLLIARNNSELGINGRLLALDLPVLLKDSEHGWEKGVKFRQYLPVKLVQIETTYLITCEAVGPPSDTPIINNGSSQHPELEDHTMYATAAESRIND